MVSMTCPTIPDKPKDPKPFFQNGQIDFKAHDVGWLVCGIMALIATISSTWLIWKHLTYYTCPTQQRHIVRLLVMVPIYAIVSFLSYLFYEEALYYQTIRDCYEAVLVTSFFYLILAYTGDTRAEQHAVFRNLELADRFWVWPLSRWKYKPEGMHFLWLMKICVLQYAIVRPLCTFVAVGTEYFGYYCLHSWMPWFTHVWCALLISISVTVAMYCLIQLYVPIKKFVDPYKPVLKFLSIKTIVFLTFWQDVMLSFLVSFGAIKETEYFTTDQIQAGLNALLQCFWMLLFGFIHIKAFSYLPYRPEDHSRTTLRGRALLDALDFRDWFFEMKESTCYMAARSKGRNYTLAEDLRAKRHQHLLNAFGKLRTANLDTEVDTEKAALPTFWKNPENARPWPHSSTIRQGSEVTEPLQDSHARRAAELQRLVAELDLQDVDQSIIGAEDHDYGYEDEKYERAALMRPYPPNHKDWDPPTGDEEHPELTQYHVATMPLANVPSLSYDHDESSSSVKRVGELEAVAEEEELPSHVRRSSRVAPGVGAFGIASWFGWNNNGTCHEPQQQQHEAQNIKAGVGAGDLLRPSDAYGADAAAPRSPDGQGTGWWRNYWERLSNAGSREPSVVGREDESEKEPLTAARPAVLRQVTAGSWGIENARQQQSLSNPPTLTIETKSQARHPTGSEASIDSSASPSRISPHADSPLSRLIQTSRDSFGSLHRDEVRKQHLESTAASRMPDKTLSGSGSTTRSMGAQSVPAPAPRNSPFAASPAAAARSASAPSAHESSASKKVASEILSTLDSMTSNKHLIVFADALSDKPAVEEAEDVDASPIVATKTLPLAVGPKGKLFNLVLPSPLSPARYPYGQEGTVSNITPAAGGSRGLQDDAVGNGGTSRHQPGGSIGGGSGGTLKWAGQPSKDRSTAEPCQALELPRGKNVITVGGMSLVQAKAAQQKAAVDVQVSASTAPPPPLLPPSASAPALTAPKSILRDSQHSQSVGKLVLPAPSRLASAGMSSGGEAEDPYLAGRSATIDPAGRREKRRVSAPVRAAAAAGGGRASFAASSSAQTRTSMSTAFEVGSIVPRQAVVRASMPANGPLRGYYDSLGRSQQQLSQGDGRASEHYGYRGAETGSMQRHSFAPMSGAQPARLPPHPVVSQQYGGPPGPAYQQQQTYAMHARQSLAYQYPQPHSHSHPHSQQYPRPSPPINAQGAPQPRYPYPYPGPPPPPPPPQQARPHPQSQFQFEYYRD